MIASHRSDSDTYLTAPEAAARLNTSVRFVRRLIADRRIVFYKFGAHVRIMRSDLDAFMVAGRVDAIQGKVA